MAEYALVDDTDTIRKVRAENRLDRSAGVRAGWRWLPINNVETDKSTGPDKKAEPVTETVTATEVRRERVVRDMTAKEKSDNDDALVLSEADKALGKAIFRLVNEVRALKGEAAVNRRQFRNWLKAQL